MNVINSGAVNKTMDGVVAVGRKAVVMPCWQEGGQVKSG